MNESYILGISLSGIGYRIILGYPIYISVSEIGYCIILGYVIGRSVSEIGLQYYTRLSPQEINTQESQITIDSLICIRLTFHSNIMCVEVDKSWNASNVQ